MEPILSARVGEALEAAILSDDVSAIADAFVEMYTLAHLGPQDLGYAIGVDDVAHAILTRNTGQ